MPVGAGARPPFRAGLLLAAGEGASSVSALFPALAEEDLWEGLFQLLYTQHGGSGLSLTMTEAMELDLDRMRWLLERLGEERQREARAIEQAARKRK
ncbi:MAG: hypothetical protein ACYCWW_00895 [Deltaproteobacteria bacterium]